MSDEQAAQERRTLQAQLEHDVAAAHERIARQTADIQAETARRVADATAEADAALAAARAAFAAQQAAHQQRLAEVEASFHTQADERKEQLGIETDRTDQTLIAEQTSLTQRTNAQEAKLRREHSSATAAQVRSVVGHVGFKIGAAGAALIVFVANVVSDQPEYANAPVLSQVNNVWDGITMPIRDGIVNLFTDDPPAAGIVVAPIADVGPAPLLSLPSDPTLGQALGR